MPLLVSDYDQKFVQVKGEDAVSQALDALLARGGADDWHVVVEWPDKKLGVLGVDQLKGLLIQLGPALFDTTFNELKARVLTAGVAQRTIGIGTAENRAKDDPQGVLVIMDGEKIAGRMYKEGVKVERGPDPFPASTMSQLYGDYINTHLDARATWRPKGVEAPTCPQCGHVGFYRYRATDGTHYCDACKKTI